MQIPLAEALAPQSDRRRPVVGFGLTGAFLHYLFHGLGPSCLLAAALHTQSLHKIKVLELNNKS